MRENGTEKARAALRRKRAFTLPELMIVMLIMAIIGGAAISSLLTIFNMFEQLNDYIAGRQEMEFVVQTIGQEISNVGLGMPNNRQERGTFATSFTRPPGEPQPIMTKMGLWHEKWGGPVTLSAGSASFNFNTIPMVTSLNVEGRAYGGPELFYAWGAPTGIKVFVSEGANISGAAIPAADDVSYRSGRHNEQHRGATLRLKALTTPASGASMTLQQLAEGDGALKKKEKWVLFPTARLPMLVDGYNTGLELLTVRLAPHAAADLKAAIVGMDEIYLPRVSRIFLRPYDANDPVNPTRGQVVQQIFGPPDYNVVTRENLLANNIDGLYFTYEPALRVLSMYIASRGGGITRNPATSSSTWISDAIYPGAGVIPGDLRLLVNRVDWRIRN